MRVVAGGAREVRVFGIVAAAGKQTIGLETNIVDAAEIRHHRHGVGKILRAQYFALPRGPERVGHCSVRLRTALSGVTTGTGSRAYPLFTGYFFPRSKVGEGNNLVRFLLRKRQTGEKKHAQSQAPTKKGSADSLQKDDPAGLPSAGNEGHLMATISQRLPGPPQEQEFDQRRERRSPLFFR
jgi:hypothetical protein